MRNDCVENRTLKVKFGYIKWVLRKQFLKNKTMRNKNNTQKKRKTQQNQH